MPFCKQTSMTEIATYEPAAASVVGYVRADSYENALLQLIPEQRSCKKTPPLARPEDSQDLPDVLPLELRTPIVSPPRGRGGSCGEDSDFTKSDEELPVIRIEPSRTMLTPRICITNGSPPSSPVVIYSPTKSSLPDVTGHQKPVLRRSSAVTSSPPGSPTIAHAGTPLLDTIVASPPPPQPPPPSTEPANSKETTNLQPPSPAVRPRGIDINRNGTNKDLRSPMSPTASRTADCAVEQHAENVLTEFAKTYLNVPTAERHNPAALICRTIGITRRRHHHQDLIPFREILRYTKNSSISSPHFSMLSRENAPVACATFKDFCRYIRGELRSDAACTAIRTAVARALGSAELRDELMWQLLRQSVATPTAGDLERRVWVLLAVCTAAFAPSKTFLKILIGYFRWRAGKPADGCANYARMCVRHLEVSGGSHSRRMPPSVQEIEALAKLQTPTQSVQLPDGSELQIAVDPCQRIDTTLALALQKARLSASSGWALYEKTKENLRYIKETEFLADVISNWEEMQRQRLAARSSSSSSSPRKSSPRKSSPRQLDFRDFGRLVLRQRVFAGGTMTTPPEGSERDLLFRQAVDDSVKMDDLHASEELALHLAGLQAQVLYGRHEKDATNRYDDIEKFLSQRILLGSSRNWPLEIEEAHQRFGRTRGRQDAEGCYLQVLSQLPLYATNRFVANYAGYWQYGIEFLLILNPKDLKLASIKKKTIICAHSYEDIERVDIDMEDSTATILLREELKVRQQLYHFEVLDVREMAELLQIYAPHVVTWSPSSLDEPIAWHPDLGDWLALCDDILRTRRQLVDTGKVRRPQETSGGILRIALKRLHGGRDSRGTNPIEEEEVSEQSDYWSFSRVQSKQPILVFDSHVLQDTAIRLFNSALVYAGIESTAILEETDMLVVVQTLIAKCMEHAELRDEFYMQLIKQTNDCPQESGEHFWNLLCVQCSLVLPSERLVWRYLVLHLRRQCHQRLDSPADRSAMFCLRGLSRLDDQPPRQQPPSHREIKAICRRKPIETRVTVPDGRQFLVEFDSAAFVSEVVTSVKLKLGMRSSASGFGVFQQKADGGEVYLSLKSRLADAVAKAEKSQSKLESGDEIRFAFKKRIFVEPLLNPNDPVELEAVYHQCVTDVFEANIQTTKSDAIQLCALRAQMECGDHGKATSLDYSSALRILPRPLRAQLKSCQIEAAHQLVRGLDADGANLAFLDVLTHWPLFGVVVYQANQTYSQGMPAQVHVGVSQLGVHLMDDVFGKVIYASHAMDDVVQVDAAGKNLTLHLHNVHNGRKLTFTSPNAARISECIGETKAALLTRTRCRRHKSFNRRIRRSVTRRRSRP